ncbi:hypothetical protein [Providencia stuartii]|uniref:hypothetical protein n=1 Tax=Providencia stuartii TaxID=588 RepID=UPI001F471758
MNFRIATYVAFFMGEIWKRYTVQKGAGGGGHTPVESKDSLLSESTAKILLAISEGEIAGGLDDTRIFS